MLGGKISKLKINNAEVNHSCGMVFHSHWYFWSQHVTDGSKHLHWVQWWPLASHTEGTEGNEEQVGFINSLFSDEGF